MKTKKEIGATLRTLRGERTLQIVAEAIGVSASSIGMYERGERVPTDCVKYQLAQYYGISVGALFFGEDDTKSVISS